MRRFIYFLIILVGCAAPVKEGIELINAEKLIELQNSGVTIVDLRTPGEFDLGYIPGVLHMDFMTHDFLARMKELDKSKPVVIYCAVGGRSRRASNMLKKAGFKMIYDYSGGFSDWKSKGLPIEQ